ncbi:hypothetical protein BKA62DRAFT_221002 [Auriculariales sp. MPI-PUGE-AT-0066]|nr:hypothetical protein BKA62DRAFT_221002 [Auriculariales sp. MPI-PUGE-AT-0066]
MGISTGDGNRTAQNHYHHPVSYGESSAAGLGDEYTGNGGFITPGGPGASYSFGDNRTPFLTSQQVHAAHLHKHTDMATPNYLPAHGVYPPPLSIPDSRTSSEQPTSAQAHTHSQSPEVDVASPTSANRLVTAQHPSLPLSADQPPTTHGKARTRVYVACLQCRTRKIRCDGAKPTCHNCTRRNCNDCKYDAVPKRRGPDKKPGARQRTVKKRELDDIDAPLSPNTKKRRRRDDADAAAAKAELDGVGVSDGSAGAVSPDIPSMPGPSGHHAAAVYIQNPMATLEQDRQGVPIIPVPSQHDGYPGSSGLLRGRVNTLTPPHALRAILPYPSPPPLQSAPQRTPSLDSGLVHVFAPFSSLVPDRTQHPQQISKDDGEKDSNPLPFIHTQHTQLRNRLTAAGHEIGAEPSMDFPRKTWWDSLVSVYGPNSSTSTELVIADLTFLAA